MVHGRTMVLQDLSLRPATVHLEVTGAGLPPATSPTLPLRPRRSPPTASNLSRFPA